MDPASAIGTASAVLSFVNFTYDFFSTVSKIYDSGEVLNIETLESVSREMKRLSSGIISSDSKSPQTPDENAIAMLAEQCQRLSQEIIDQLDKVKLKLDSNKVNKPQKFIASVKAAMRMYCREDEVMRLQRNLENCRAQLHLQLMVTQK